MKKKFVIKNLDCANCAAAVESQVRKIEGVLDAQITFATSAFVLEIEDDKFDEVFAKVIRVVHQVEPDAIVEEPNAVKAKKRVNWRKILPLCTLVLGAAVGAGALWGIEEGVWHWVMLMTAVLLVGWQTYWKALMLLFRGVVNENLLVTISMIGTIAIGDHEDGLMVVCLYTIGKILESLAVERSKKSISALMELQPQYANLVDDDHTHKVAPEDVPVGSRILVKMGERVPLDGKCVSEGGFVDSRHLTGESAPVRVNKGDEILSGCIVLDGVFEIETTKTYENSTISQIMNMLETASEKKSKTETFISKFAKWYTYGIIAVALITFGIVFAVIGNSSEAIYRGLTILVIGCPCAFAISVPLTYFSGIGNASKKGILIKGSNFLDVCANLDAVVFDKTGTLTSGHFGISKIEVADKSKTKEQILLLAASGEQLSIHPIARAIVHATKGKKLFDVSNFKEIAGKGVLFETGGNKYEVFGDPNSTGESVFVNENGKTIGTIFLVDQIKPESYLAVSALQKKKIRSVILSGDNRRVAKSVAEELGVDEWHADQQPKDKFAWLENLLKTKSKTQKIAFVGDGINDAPALRMADVGISMGLEGSPATVEASDVVLVDDNPAKLAEAIELSRHTKKIVVENVAFALAIKLAVLVLSIFGISNMILAVFADVGVTVLCVLNSLRALFYRLPKHHKHVCCHHGEHEHCHEHNHEHCHCHEHK